MLYIAVCDETNNVKMFTDYDDFKAFAVKERYAYSYFELENMHPIPDVDLFYND